VGMTIVGGGVMWPNRSVESSRFGDSDSLLPLVDVEHGAVVVCLCLKRLEVGSHQHVQVRRA